MFAGKAVVFSVLSAGTNIKLWWRYLMLTNTLAYYSARLITSVKRFTTQTHGSFVEPEPEHGSRAQTKFMVEVLLCGWGGGGQ